MKKKQIFSANALLPDGWAKNVLVDLADDGTIAEIVSDAPADTVQFASQVGVLLPAITNLHSHTFQRAMAGRTEFRSASHDNFWVWRDLMYKFLDHLVPEHVEAIAAQVFMEMVEAGYSAVGEFHYVHHQPGGVPYDRLSELSQRIFTAADQTGIGLTHLPVLYSYGGAGEAALSGGQLRFGNDLDRYCKLVDEIRLSAREFAPADTRVGIAPHSLRATSPQQLGEFRAQLDDCPVHIHIAEQTREVEEIENWLGNRPVAWLLDNLPVGPDWCLIHATHMTDGETTAFAQTGAVAGLCPITEANLGDGAFEGTKFLTAGGAFGIGSDSNVRISLAEELRQLEYSQRIRDRARNVLTTGPGSVGEGLYTRAAIGGAQALGRNAGEIRTGFVADLVAIDANNDQLYGLQVSQILDGWIFAASDNVVTDVWSAGRHCVQDGQHRERAAITSRFRSAMDDLVSLL